MPYIGKSPLHGNYQKLDSISSSFDGSTTQFALTTSSLAVTPVTEAALIISINGVLQEPVTTYTVSGTNITFTSAPASTDTFFGVVLGEQLAIGTPSDSTVTSAKLSGNLVTPGTLDVNGQELILDADADTSITADTDDQIDFKISGADDFRMTANNFNVLSGSTLTIDSGASITNSGTATGFGSNVPTSANGQALGSASLEWSDLYLADGSVIYFGNDQEITLTHVADSGITLKNTKTADDAGSFNLTLQSGETDIAADDILGKIMFSAPDEATGTDAILTAAAIAARSEGDFSSSSNATSLDFMLGVSETASTKMTLNSSRNLSVGDGTASLPSYSNVGDLNTGIYFPAADTVGVTVGGTEQFRFGSNLIAGGSKNLIINGGMQIAQRDGLTNTGLGAAGQYLECDRWRLEWNSGSASRYTITQEAGTGGVNGKSDWLKVDVTTADTTPTGNEYQSIHTYIEAQNCLALLDSSGDFKPFTISFDVILNGDGTGVAASNPKLACFVENSDGNRHYVKDVTIASGQAAAWERVSFTVPADTTATVNNDNGPGLSVGFILVAGSSDNTTDGAWGTGTGGDHSTSSSSNIAYHVNNYLGITNVQLEVGSVATDFEYEPIGVTFWKCLRYYRRITHNFGQAAMPVASVRSDDNQKSGFTLEPPMRAAPSLATSGNANDYNMNHGSGNTVCDAVPSIAGASTLVASLRYQTDGGPTAGFASQLEFLEGSGAGFLAFDAEI